MSSEKKSGKGLSRRDFIKAAGITTAGIMTSSFAKSPVYSIAPGRVIGANDRIGVGLVGIGGQGASHLRTIVRGGEKDNAAAVAVCDVWDKRLQGAKTTANLPDAKAYKDYRKLIEDKDVDAVLIATPEHWHSKMAIEAMENGQHCYIEKPMTRHLNEAFAILNTATKTKKVVQVGAQGTSSEKWLKANELIKAGALGQLVWSQASYCRNGKNGEWNYAIDPELTEKNCDWKMWLGPCANKSFSPDIYFRWRKYKEYSAGILSDLLPHRMHSLMTVLGAEYPLRVACVGTNKVHPDRDVADNTQVLVEFPSGHTMVLVGVTSNEQGLPDVVRGHKATMYLSGSKLEVRPERPFVEEIEPRDVDIEKPDAGLTEHHSNFFNAIRGLEQAKCGIDLATKVQTIVCLAEKSWLENKMINFDPKTLKII